MCDFLFISLYITGFMLGLLLIISFCRCTLATQTREYLKYSFNDEDSPVLGILATLFIPGVNVVMICVVVFGTVLYGLYKISMWRES